MSLAAFKSAGVTSLDNPDELFPVAETLANLPPIRNNQIAILADGGGHATIASDLLTDHQENLIELCEATQSKLKRVLPHTASLANPVDVAGSSDSDPAVLAECARTILADEQIGGLLIVGMFGGYGIRFAEKLKFEEEATAHQFARVVAEKGKPLIIHSIYTHATPHAIAILKHCKIPVYGSLSVACTCVVALSDYGRYLNQTRSESKFDLDSGAGASENGVALVSAVLSDGRTFLLENEAKDLLYAHGVAVTRDRLAKIVSPDILHKSDAGGVRLKLRGSDAVRTAYSEIVNNARACDPKADIRGCLVCPMVAQRIELIVGVRHDEQF